MVKKLKVLKVISSLPPEFLLAKAKQSMVKKYLLNNRRMKVRPVIEKSEQFKSTYPVFCFNRADLRKVIEETACETLIKDKADEVAGHRLDLLGSGLTAVGYESEVKGTLGQYYQMMPGDAEEFAYQPIDWHLDFKSGYRWNPKMPGNKQSLSPHPGADVKVPWELSRFQHAPLLGLAGLLDQDSERWVREFVLQVTDWITANPYPYGINWSCTMDVAIRAVNWLWGWVLFKDSLIIKTEFTKLLTDSLYQHGRHIEGNLEFIRRGYHGNHYLSNIVGLIYIGSFMPFFPESDRWLAFGIQELIEEMKYQINADGTCFEGSSAYHRLVAELFYSATAVVLNLDKKRRASLKEYHYKEHLVKPRLKPSNQQEFNPDREEVFPRWYFEKLERMAEFTADLMKPNALIPQFGDNDNGRLHKFTPVLNKCGEEEVNDHRHILALAGKMFGRDDLRRAGQAFKLDAELLLGQVPFLPVEGLGKRKVAAGRFMGTEGFSAGLNGQNRFDSNKGIESRIAFRIIEKKKPYELKSPNVFYYPDGGIVIYKSDLYYFAFTCIPCGLDGVGAHNHNDLLSFELNVQGQDFIVDGGSYLYKADPDLRNKFRSTWAHNTVAVEGREQREIPEKLLFALPDQGKSRMIEVCENKLSGYHDGFGFRHNREVLFEEDSILIRDYLEKRCKAYFIVNLAPNVTINKVDEQLAILNSGGVELEIRGSGLINLRIEEGYHSTGYGNRVNNKRLLIPFCIK